MKVYERGLGPTSIRQSKDVRVDITQLLEPCDELDRRARRSLFFKAETEADSFRLRILSECLDFMR